MHHSERRCSLRASLLVAYISRYARSYAPRRGGRSTPRMAHVSGRILMRAHVLTVRRRAGIGVSSDRESQRLALFARVSSIEPVHETPPWDEW